VTASIGHFSILITSITSRWRRRTGNSSGHGQCDVASDSSHLREMGISVRTPDGSRQTIVKRLKTPQYFSFPFVNIVLDPASSPMPAMI
jgi:hypothetical protein